MERELHEKKVVYNMKEQDNTEKQISQLELLLNQEFNAFTKQWHGVLNQGELQTLAKFIQQVVEKENTTPKVVSIEQYIHTPQSIDSFIRELQAISDNKRKLPLVIDCPNGLQVYPEIKMRWNNALDMFSKDPDKMVITYQ